MQVYRARRLSEARPPGGGHRPDWQAMGEEVVLKMIGVQVTKSQVSSPRSSERSMMDAIGMERDNQAACVRCRGHHWDAGWQVKDRYSLEDDQDLLDKQTREFIERWVSSH
jgi:hypothetical protein